MRLLRNTFALLLIAKSVLLCQTVTISEILDANLFKLSDGRIVKLAGVDAPSDSSSIPFLRAISGFAKEYIGGYNKAKLELDSVSVDQNNRYTLVFLYKKYTLQDLNLNESFLMNGYGKFINNIGTHESTDLKAAQAAAVKSEKGIWRFFTPTENDTLDCYLSESGVAKIVTPDSSKLNNSYNQSPVAGKIAFELLAGSGVTLVSTLAGFAIAASISTQDGWAMLGGGVIGFALGYGIGFPTMIYLIAKEENPNLDPWLNFGCSWGLTLATGLIASQIKVSNHPMYYVAFFSPIIGSLLYSHILAPQSPTKNNSLLLPDRKINSFNNFRESQTTRIELFRLTF